MLLGLGFISEPGDSEDPKMQRRELGDVVRREYLRLEHTRSPHLETAQWPGRLGVAHCGHSGPGQDSGHDNLLVRFLDAAAARIRPHGYMQLSAAALRHRHTLSILLMPRYSSMAFHGEGEGEGLGVNRGLCSPTFEFPGAPHLDTN